VCGLTCLLVVGFVGGGAGKSVMILMILPLVTGRNDGVLLSVRSIVWLQNKRDAALERLRGPSPRREDAHEFRVGRLKHERVCVPRDDSLLEWATQVMKYHGDRKAVLEVSHLYSHHLGSQSNPLQKSADLFEICMTSDDDVTVCIHCG